MSKKNGFSRLETITPSVLLLPPARLRACRFGWYFSSSIALTTRARVELFTTPALLRTRETVAVDTFARRATCSRFIASLHSTVTPLFALFHHLAQPRSLALQLALAGYERQHIRRQHRPRCRCAITQHRVTAL